ncbi:MAG: hypothetical protein U0353_32095 [Sandaracinus sp.]
MGDTEHGENTGSPARTIALASMTDAQRAELAKALGPEGMLVARGRDRFVVRERLALGMVPFSIVALLALGLASFADACWPVQTWIWAALYAVACLPIAYVVTRALAVSLAARRMPIAPGVYVTSEDVIVAHARSAAVLRVVPVTAVAAVGTPRRLPLSSHAELTVWMEHEPAETLSVPALEADATVGAIERAREPLGQADRAARRRDPLGELKRTTVWEKASTAAPSSELPRAIAVSGVVALALGALVLTVRNAASDRVAVQSAIAGNDVHALRCYVEHGGVHAAHVASNALPHAAYERAVASGDLAQLGAYVEEYPEGPDTERARVDWIAGEYASARDDAWRLRAFLARFPDAPQRDEARARLPRLALEAAIAADDVGSYAFVAREHPGTSEAAEASRRRTDRYARVLDALVTRGGRAEAIAFFRALFAYLEAHETHDVLVRFRTPSSELLRDFDRVASDLAEQPVEPIGPSFSRRLSERREALVFDRLRTAFEQVAPRDVLPVVRGQQLPDALSDEERAAMLAPYLDDPDGLRAATEALDRDRDADSGEPEIRIDYEIVPDGRLFTSSRERVGDPALAAALGRLGLDRPDEIDEPDDRAFAGFLVRFDIEMRTPLEPGATEPPPRARFRVEVAPPPSFELDAGEGRASASAVYEAMATEAFDRLGAELSAAFFGAASLGAGSDGAGSLGAGSDGAGPLGAGSDGAGSDGADATIP